MRFRTELEGISYPFKINHTDKLMFIGSCFSDEMSKKFGLEGFQLLANPFGTIYNPISICKNIEAVIDQKKATATDLVKHDDSWVSLQHNTRFRDSDPGKLIKLINTTNSKAHEFLRSANYIFITLGTSWAFTFKHSEAVVANCQKMPASLFERELLSVSEIRESLERLTNELHNFNDKLKVVFTVSPVRHLKDGLVANSLSKATLHVALNGLSSVHYFPSYELVLDDLRDYRYFADDLCHVNEQGIDYVWSKVEDWLLNPSSAKSRSEVRQWRKLAAHRVVGGQAAAERQLQLVNDKKTKLLEKYPFLNLS